MRNNRLYDIKDLKSLNLLFEKSGDGVLIANVKTKKFIYANSRICQLLGYSKTEILKLGISDIHPKKDLKKVLGEFAKAQKGKVLAKFLPVIKKNKEIVYCDIGQARAEAEGEEAVIGFFRDVTDLRLLRLAIRDKEVISTEMFEGSAIPMFMINMDHEITHWNKACEITFKISAKKMIGTKNQWKPYYSKKRPVMADLVIDNAPLKDFAKWYSRDSKPFFVKSNTIPMAYSAVDFFPQIGKTGKWLSFTAAPVRSIAGKIIGAIETLEDVTERKQAELKFKRSEEILNATQKLARIGGWVWDLKKNTMFWTDEVYNLHGLKKGGIANNINAYINASLERYDVKDRRLVMQAFKKCVKRGVPYDLEFPFTRADGKRRWVRTLTYPIKESGKIVKVIGDFMDITDRKEVLEKLKENEEKYSLAINKTGQVIYEYDIKSGSIKWLGATKEVFGYTLAEMQKINIQKWEKMIHVDDRKEMIKLLSEAEKEVGKYFVEYRFQRKDGEYIYVKDKGIFLKGKKNKAEKMIGAMEDITEMKKANEMIIDTNQRLRDLYNNVPGAVYRCAYNSHWTMRDISDDIKNITGYSSAEVINNKAISYNDIIYPEDRVMVRRIIDETIAKDKVFEIDYRIVTKKGEIKWIHERGKVVLDEGYIKYIDGILFDFTDRKKIDEALKKEKDLSQKYLDLVGVMVFVLDMNGEVTTINKKGLEILEGKEEEIIGKNWFRNFLPKNNQKEVKKVFSKIVTGKFKSVEYYENEIKTCKGNRKLIFWHNSEVKDEKGKIKFLISSGEDVTEKRRIEKELEESEKKYRSLVEFASDSILLIDTKGVIQEANEAIKKSLGYDKSQIVGKRINELSFMLPKESMALILKNFSKRIIGIKSEAYVVKMISAKGKIGFFDITANLIKNNDKVIGVLAIIRDVTEREEDRQLLKESEIKYRSLITNIPNAVYTTLPDKHRSCLFMSEKWKTWSGYSPEEFYADKHIWFKIIHPDDRKRVSVVLENSFQNGKPYTLEYRILHRALDKVHYILDQGAPNKDKNGKILSYNGIATNISRIKLVEKELKESEERFRDISFSSGDMIWEIDNESRYTFVAGDTVKVLKYTKAEMIGKSIYEFMPKDEAEKAKIIFDSLISRRKPIVDLENWRLTRDGKRLIFLVNGIPIFNSDNECIGYRGVNKDITLRKKAEERVRASEEKLRTVVESIGDGVFVLDQNYKVLMFNKQATKISGFSREEVVGKRYDSVLKFIFENSGKVNREFIDQSIKKGNRADMSNHTQLIRKDGGKISVADSSSPLRDENRNIIGCVVVFRDISREREIDNMKSEFISVASHQLKTPLSGIKWFTELLLREKVGGLNDKQKDFIDQIRISNERLVSLVSDLLSVSNIETNRKFEIKKRKVDICKVIERVIEAISPMANKRKVKVFQEECFLSKIKVYVDEEKIQQVFFNLITNAIKYSRENGEVFVGAEVIKNNELIFFIQDNGIGIDDKDFPKVFSKFYRGDNALKSETDGTGLGLYIAKSIIEAHGGEIWFDSKKDIGTTFYFSVKGGK